MKKLAMLMLMIVMSISVIGAKTAQHKKWYEHDSRIEIVNEKTIILREVVKIEFKTNNPTQVTYVYDLNKSKLVKAVRGSFEIELNLGNYLIQSDRKITKTLYEIIIE